MCAAAAPVSARARCSTSPTPWSGSMPSCSRAARRSGSRPAAWFWAAPFEIDGEYGGRGLPASFTPDMLSMRIKGAAAATSVENTTLAIVVTDAELTKPQAKRLAMIAQTGFARAIYPVHTPLDGDVLFAAATCEKRSEERRVGKECRYRRS